MRGSSDRFFAAVFAGFDAARRAACPARCCRRTAAAGRRACRRRPARCGRRCCRNRAARSHRMRRRPACRRAPAARGTASARVWRPAGAARRRRGPRTRIRLRESVSHSSARPSMSGAPESTTGVMSRALLAAHGRQRIRAEQQFLAALERAGNRGGHGEQRLLFALAQHGFHLARVLAAGPRQRERGQRQQQ